MLRKLLSLIARGEVSSLADAAESLGVGADAVRPMIDQLVSLGYLETAGSPRGARSSCSGGCGGCGKSGSCAACRPGANGIAWLITEKGRALSDSAAPAP